jgi:hypothetical protein
MHAQRAGSESPQWTDRANAANAVRACASADSAAAVLPARCAGTYLDAAGVIVLQRCIVLSHGPCSLAILQSHDHLGGAFHFLHLPLHPPLLGVSDPYPAPYGVNNHRLLFLARHLVDQARGQG